MISNVFTVQTTISSEVDCIVVIDSLVNGTSSGGVRIIDDVQEKEVHILASEMTLKYGFCGLPRGGAKCGIRIPSSMCRETKLRMLEEVGKHLQAIIQAGIYYPGMDINCGPDELRAIYRGAGIKLGEVTDTSLFTAIFVAEAIRATAGALDPSGDRRLTVAIEGFGNVATHLVKRLDPARFLFVAVSTVTGASYHANGYPAALLEGERSVHGDRLVEHLPGDRLNPKEKLLSLPVDILVPAARVGSINASNMQDVMARAIVPAANAPYSLDALEFLHNKGTIVLPGFVCNAGGVLGSSLFDRGARSCEIETLASGPYRESVACLLAESRERNVQPTILASSVARGCIEQRQHRRQSRLVSLANRVLSRSEIIRRMQNAKAVPQFADHFRAICRAIDGSGVERHGAAGRAQTIRARGQE